MARGDMKQSVTVDLEGNLPQRSKVYEKALQRMGQRGERYMSITARMASIAGRGLDQLGNRYTGLLSGATVAYAVKQVGDLSERYTRLGINANISADKVDQLKEQVFDISQAPDIRVDPAEMLGAIEDIVEKTGDLQFAQDNIRNIGLAIQATGATGQDVGAMLAEFQKQGITAPGEVLKVIDLLNQQGKEGAFTLKDIASMGPRVVAAYNATGRSGVQAMKEMGAALQVIRMGTGSSEQAATAFEAVLRTMSDPKKIKQLEELGGISVFDPELLKEGKQQLRPINELMVEIVKAANGKQTNLAQVFDAEAMRAFNTAAAEYQRTGSIESLERFMRVNGDGITTMRDSARAAREFNASLTYLGAGWDEFANDNLTGPINDLADLLHEADKETVQLALNTAKWSAAVLGVAIAGRKMYGVYKGAKGLFGKGAGLGGKDKDSLTNNLGSMKPIPVYVVNGRSGGDGFGSGKSSGRRGGVKSASNKWQWDRGTRAVGTATAAFAAWETGSAIGGMIYDAIDESQFADNLGGTIATILANFGNKEAQRALDSRLESNVSGSLNIHIDSEGRPHVRDMESSGIDLDVDAGPTMGVMP